MTILPLITFALVTATPPPGVDRPVHALAADAHALYAGGSFATASGTSAANIARWDGDTWQPLGAGTDGPVYALLVDGSDVYAGGTFANAGGNPANNIARWNGSAWSSVDAGVSGTGAVVKCISRDASGMLMGGMFTQVGTSTPANGFARWTGSEWNVLGGIVPGIVHDIRAVQPLNRTIYVGGVLLFPESTRPSEATLARATPFVLSDHAGSANADNECTGCASVDALAANATDLFAGGAFTTLGQTTVLGSPYAVVRLAGAVTPLGLGDGSITPPVSQGGAVLALLVDGNTLIAGGTFVTLRGVSAAHIAQWNGSTWSALGTGLSGNVRALATFNGRIYAAGDFISAGGVTANHIACWDGTTWSALATTPTPSRSTTWGALKNRFR